MSVKHVVAVLVLYLSVLACKSEAKQTVASEANSGQSYDQNDGLITMKGAFVYFADAAVLQTKNDIYGVVIDAEMHQLDKQVKPYKKEATDMVPVTVRVRKFPKPKDEEGWPYRVEIKEILKVEAPDTTKNDIIKLAN
jgi:hypothetical protein